MKKELTIVLLYILLSLVTGCSDSYKPIRNELPHIVFISIDTLRADHLGSYGSSLPVSPVLDRIAQDGTLFSDVTVQGTYTLPSHCSMLTGLLVSNHGVLSSSNKLTPEIPLMSSILKEQGYHTIAFAGGGFISPAYGFDIGFDVFQIPGRKFEHVIPGTLEYLGNLKRRKSFFLFLHAYDVHLPYSAPDPYSQLFLGQYPKKQINRLAIPDEAYKNGETDLGYYLASYDSELRHADFQLSKLFYEFKKAGIYKNTIFIITSDHGEELMDHRAFSHRFISLLQSNISVPLILVGPGIQKGKVITQPVQSIDILPWLLETLKIEIPQKIDGVNLMNANNNQPAEPILSESSSYHYLLLNSGYESFDGSVYIRAGIIESKNKNVPILKAIQKEFGNSPDLIINQGNNSFLIDNGFCNFQIQLCGTNSNYAGFLMLEFTQQKDDKLEEKLFSGQGCIVNPPDTPDENWKQLEVGEFVFYLPENYPVRRYYNSLLIREGIWKFIVDEGTGKTQLYNIEKDPQEFNNCVSDYPEVANSFLKKIQQHFQKNEFKFTSQTIKPEDMNINTIEQLRELGYLADN